MKTVVVVDASVAVKWVLLEEDSPSALWNSVKSKLSWARWFGDYQPELS